jgi:hypothetical protein
MWFYALRNQQQGPVKEDVLKTLLQDRTIDGSTLVWKEGMAQWTPLAQTELARLIPTPTSMPTAAPVVPATPGYYQPYNAQLQKPAAERIKELNYTFNAWWILLVSGVGAILIGVLISTLLLLGTTSSSTDFLVGLFSFLGVLALIAATVLQYILTYRYWETIQSIHPRTTPGKAVGYMFIPFFSIYWIWEAYHGLSKDMNLYMNVNNMPGERINEGLSLAYCILLWCSIIPYVNFLTGPATSVIFIILMVKWKNAAARIIAQQQ